MRCRLAANSAGMSTGSLSSMIDIVFLLIIFFVVTASFDREEIDPQLKLPSVDSAAIKSMPPQRMMVNVLADGSVKFGFSRLDAAEVASGLGAAMRSMNADGNTVLIVNGDRDTPHKYIAAVLDAAAKAGYSQVRINAEVKKE